MTTKLIKMIDDKMYQTNIVTYKLHVIILYTHRNS